MKKIASIILRFQLILLAVVFTACGDDVHDYVYNEALVHEMSDVRYKSISAMSHLCDSIDGLKMKDDGGIVKNSRAYVAMMQMRYEDAEKIYEDVISTASCDVERFTAYVGQMMIYYRTSQNRKFFDRRASALSLIRRINEEENLLPEGEWQRFMRAKIEYDVISLCYFATLGMSEEWEQSAHYLKENLAKVEEDLSLGNYGEMMLISSENSEEDVKNNLLMKGVVDARKLGNLWCEANYELLLAISLRGDDEPLGEGTTQRLLQTTDEVSRADVPYMLAIKAADGFKEYGDDYMMIEALGVAASCNIQSGYYSEALILLEEALGCINDYYKRNYPSKDIPALAMQPSQDGVEMALLERTDIYNIPECLLSVRREASCAYAGLGDKYASDINRNSYLDILRAIRLNKQMESRMQRAEDEMQRLYFWSVVSALLLVVTLLSAIYLSIRWRRRNRKDTENMDAILNGCRALMTSLPPDMEDKAQVYAAVEEIMNSSLSSCIGGQFVLRGADDDAPDGVCSSFAVERIDGSGCDTLYVISLQPLDEERISLLNMILQYIAVAIDEGMNIANLGDEQQRIEQERKSYDIYISDHKRENIKKRVSMTIVGCMRPYIDRLLNEMRRLSTAANIGDEQQRRMNYVAELTDKLDELNVILEHWIKMRNGDMSLQIENFSLSEIFALIDKGAQSLALRGVTLTVEPTGAVVKADRALTLFMINTLTENAGKFTPEGGEVRVSTVETDDYVEIAVSDTGVGMSPEEVQQMMGSRVYDASSIGRDSAKAQNKGGGFGIMNSKGIIEKYKKTDAVFSVCRFDIESEKGKGSRFSFRLPRGVVRSIVVLLAMIAPGVIWAQSNAMDNINALADSVYNCNVEGRHTDALLFAEEAVGEINRYYRAEIAGTDTMSLSSGAAAEVEWWRNELFADSVKRPLFFNILDIRNEAAVAALAENDWETYRYNNNIYALLYRLVHEDKGLVGHFEKMEQQTKYRRVAVAISLAVLFVLLVVVLLRYLRHRLIEKMNMQLVQDINRNLLSKMGGKRLPPNEIAEVVAGEIYGGMREMMRMLRVSVLLHSKKDGDVFAAVPTASERGDVLLQRAYTSQSAIKYTGGLVYLFPLTVNASENTLCIGAVEVETNRELADSEVATIEIVVRYAASVAYHSAVRMVEKYRDLKEVEEEMERAKYEENRLHVQNMVMDNCLSVLKHETIYYPGRIRSMVEKLRDVSGEEWRVGIAGIRELADYYNSIFSVLSACASRQLDDVGFRPVAYPLQKLFDMMQKRTCKMAKRSGVDVVMRCDDTELNVLGDADMIELLGESLVDAAIRQNLPGGIYLRAAAVDGVVRVEFVDTRRHLTSEELSEMFVPTRRNIEGGACEGMEYLVAREVIRLHEDNSQWRGGRIEARDEQEGTIIMFTLPIMK